MPLRAEGDSALIALKFTRPTFAPYFAFSVLFAPHFGAGFAFGALLFSHLLRCRCLLRTPLPNLPILRRFSRGGCAKPICTFDYTPKARFGKGFLEGIFWLKEAPRWAGWGKDAGAAKSEGGFRCLEISKPQRHGDTGSFRRSPWCLRVLVLGKF
jgi:hypothetical protein